MNILICDDILSEAVNLKTILADLDKGFNTVVFDCAKEALKYVRSGKNIDISFLDIVMPDMSGIELAKALRSDGFSGEIVFLTTSNEYAAESYAVDAFSYLLKPPTKDNVSMIMQKLKNLRDRAAAEGIMLITARKKQFVPFRDISHVEIINHNLYFQLMDSSQIEHRATLSEIAPKLLEDRRFVQCSRSFIINIDAVSRISGKYFIMHCGKSISITKNYALAEIQYIERTASRRK